MQIILMFIYVRSYVGVCVKVLYLLLHWDLRFPASYIPNIISVYYICILPTSLLWYNQYKVLPHPTGS